MGAECPLGPGSRPQKREGPPDPGRPFALISLGSECAQPPVPPTGFTVVVVLVVVAEPV